MTVILIIIMVLVLFTLIIIGLALQNVNTDKYNITPSDELAQNAAMSALLENEAYISENELNSMFAYLIDTADESGIMGGQVKLNSVYLELVENSSKLYFQVNYNGRNLDFTADADIYLDENAGTVKIQLENAAVGKLKIPRSVLIYALKKTNLTSSQFVSIDETTVSLPSCYSVTIKDVGTLVEIDILNLSVSEHELYIQTNPIGQDIADNVTSILGDSVESYINEFKDKVSEYYGY